MAVYPGIARRLLEESLNRGNLEVVDQILTPDALVHLLLYQPERGTVSGRAAFKDFVATQRRRVEALHLEIDQFLDAGHTVTALCTLQGERAGRRAAWHLVVILHLHDAKVAEAWIIADDLGLYRQLELDILTPEVMSAVRGE